MKGAVMHLDASLVAAFLDGQLAAEERTRVESHLADCQECRLEVVAAARILRNRRRRRWFVISPILAAAAVLVLALAPRVLVRSHVDQPVLRDPGTAKLAALETIAPRGAVSSAPRLIWSRLPETDEYRVTLFDHAGTVVWETQTGDTTTGVPDSVSLRAGSQYFWKVAARTGWDRWISSDLTGFTLGGRVAK